VASAFRRKFGALVTTDQLLQFANTMRDPEIALALVGFGNVGRRFLRLLDEAADRLDFNWRLVAIATRRHGSVVEPEGIDPAEALQAIDDGESLARLDDTPRERSGIDVIRQVTEALADDAADGRLAVIETTVLDIDDGEPATAHVRSSLEGRAHVVTTNKAPVAFAYDALEGLAESVDRVFLFEGAVMDGVPVFNLVRETMPAVFVNGFRGVVNTTCQYILSQMERGVPLDAAIADMQARGVTEADPSLDIDGWDAAAKTAALVNVLMGGSITPHQVTRSGIRDIDEGEVREALAHGRRIRLIASATRHGGRLETRVEPELIDASDPLAALGPSENALYLHTDLLGDIGIVQRTSSVTQTAYAIVSDLTRISRRLREL
jgi:homoserine dehydrogenase